MADDISNYEPNSLASVPKGKVAIFVVATYGEGDPPDNAVDLDNYLKILSQAEPARCSELQDLQYLVFGLGNSKYQYYNRFATCLDDNLERAGGRRLGYVGMKDEAVRSNRTWDEWADNAIHVLAENFESGVRESKDIIPEPCFDIVDLHSGRTRDTTSIASQSSSQYTRDYAQWHSVTIAESRVLRKTGEQTATEIDAGRTYLHVDFDMGPTEPVTTYEVGDHMAVLPHNPDHEVQRMAILFGWDRDKAGSPVKIVPRPGKTPRRLDFDFISGPTTRDAILRHHLDVCGAPGQEVMRLVAEFAPTSASKGFLLNLVDDGERFSRVMAEYRTLGEIMELSTADTQHTWPQALFPHLVRILPRLRPRYYSISSSPLVDARRISITVGVVAEPLPGGRVFRGLASNYLLNLHERGGAAWDASNADQLSEGLLTTQDTYWHPHKTTVHFRRSDFKPPKDTSRPMILVAAGSGIAPFRGFVQERRSCVGRGVTPGRTMLFYGCRSRDADFLYEEAWREAEEEGILEVDVAESRGGGEKVYVQDRIRARIDAVLALILEERAGFYICGSVDMARGVKDALIGGFRGLGKSNAEAHSFLDELKVSKQLQEDVWS